MPSVRYYNLKFVKSKKEIMLNTSNSISNNRISVIELNFLLINQMMISIKLRFLKLNIKLVVALAKEPMLLLEWLFKLKQLLKWL